MKLKAETPPVEGDENQAATASPRGQAGAGSLFEKILEQSPARPPWPMNEAFVAQCMDCRHPTLQGRVQIQWPADGAMQWVPTLQGLGVREGDRLLLQVPHGAVEPIAIGVVDGFLPRPDLERSTAVRLELKRDERFQVCSEEGQPLVEIVHDGKGPVVRLLQSETRVELAGKLSISAAELELRAERGDARIEASGDVILLGEVVKLN
jgi:hypothetical protein